MFFTLLRRELAGRRKQTVIIAVGMGLAIALVIVVNAFSAGVKDAQASVLASVYGVGTDITVTQAATAPTEGEGPGRFDFGADAGATADGTTAISTSRLEAARGTTTFDAAALDTVTAVDNVAAASGTLALTNTTFSGELPDMSQTHMGAAPGDGAAPPQGGPDGAGGSSFDVDSFSVLGLDPTAAAVGPLSSVTLSDGRTFTADDATAEVAVLDADYATTAELAVGDTITVGDSALQVVGIVASNTADAATAANVYVPLALAQELAGLDGQLSTIYVQAASSNDISQVQGDIEAALPDTTVSTQADLASSVSGSLATASSLVTNLGLWLSVAVLLAAFLIAILFTISGVTRRTREFGTLKAIGWSNRRIVGQVTGESLVQGLIGGAVGVAVGLVGVLIVNLVSPTLSGGLSSANSGFMAGGGGAAPGGGSSGATDAAAGAAGAMPGGFGQAASAAASSDITLQAPITVSVILIAVALAVLGGLLAGAFGGWRAARLRPAEALRSIG